ncbi:hypothetical protein DSO57_1027194 [Entomophthora muscae]|uniref:Uncharacterized protein n=1 Tax=Entomophthora muscae TaxID=34485 RepID=A0ACC2TD17_9FUNG|nr:hypothetical protein DSO57_1027194 [Entomophthora muscae]
MKESTQKPCLISKDFKFRANVRNDNLDAPKSQNTESESNPGQNPLQTTRLIGWERNNSLLIDEVAASPPGPKPLAAPQDSASEPPVQDARNFPEVPTPDTGGLPGEIDKFLPESYSKVPQSPREGTEPKEAPNTQINKQKDLKSSHPKAASGKPPVLSATLPYETPDANLPKPRKPDQIVCPPANPLAMYRPPGAPFGHVHFTEYPLKPEYKDYTADNILAWDPLARTTELTRYN